jgi:hypothetical protein
VILVVYRFSGASQGLEWARTKLSDETHLIPRQCLTYEAVPLTRLIGTKPALQFPRRDANEPGHGAANCGTKSRSQRRRGEYR